MVLMTFYNVQRYFVLSLEDACPTLQGVANWCELISVVAAASAANSISSRRRQADTVDAVSVCAVCSWKSVDEGCGVWRSSSRCRRSPTLELVDVKPRRCRQVPPRRWRCRRHPGPSVHTRRTSPPRPPASVRRTDTSSSTEAPRSSDNMIETRLSKVFQEYMKVMAAAIASRTSCQHSPAVYWAQFIWHSDWHCVRYRLYNLISSAFQRTVSPARGL